MRNLVSFLALAVAICGMLVVIAYAASDAYLNFRDGETDLNTTLLLDTLAPEGWTATELSRTGFNERFLTPCLAVPLLENTGTSGRGAIGYAPGSPAGTGVQLLMLETSASDASAIMSSVRRDTENNCQRGLTVGTVAQADVKLLTNSNADEAIIVDLSRRVNGELVTSTEGVVREGDYITRFSYRHDPSADPEALDVTALTAALVARIENPPSESELEAAGVVSDPSVFDRTAERLNAESSRILSSEGRISPFVGIAAVGGLVVILFTIGARLGRARETTEEPAAARPLAGSKPTLDNYGGSQRRWIRRSTHDVEASDALHDANPDDVTFDESSVRPLPEPQPVLDFPQRSIDEKLKILKEARMREPRPELIAPRAIVPSVDWTEEISKPEPKNESEPDRAAPAQQISHKALLRKLRSEHPE